MLSDLFQKAFLWSISTKRLISFSFSWMTNWQSNDDIFICFLWIWFWLKVWWDFWICKWQWWEPICLLMKFFQKFDWHFEVHSRICSFTRKFPIKFDQPKTTKLNSIELVPNDGTNSRFFKYFPFISNAKIKIFFIYFLVEFNLIIFRFFYLLLFSWKFGGNFSGNESLDCGNFRCWVGRESRTIFLYEFS